MRKPPAEVATTKEHAPMTWENSSSGAPPEEQQKSTNTTAQIE